MEVSVSFLKSKYHLKEQIIALNNSNCDLIHVDFMDGTFTKNKTISLEEMSLQDFTKPLEFHLMVTNPDNYIDYCKTFKPTHFIVHYEILKEPLKTILHIIDAGMLPGLAINPNTSIREIKTLLKYVDMVLVMSVTPGAGGQSFLPETVNKLKELKSVYKGRIEVDGGINDKTINLIKDYVDAVVSGSYVCLSDDYNQAINSLKK